jgi:hypothetical protein
MNVTIASLAIAFSSLRAPFLSPSLHFRPHSLSLSRSGFSHWFSSVVATHPSGSFHFLSSFFRCFLSLSREAEHTQLISQSVDSHTHLDWRNVTVTGCLFERCQAETGGAISASHINMTITETSFISNTARIGGAVHALSSQFVYLVRLLVLNNTAAYDGGMAVDSEKGGNCSLVELVNVSANIATKWTGGMRLDHAGGLMRSCWFDGNRAAVCGGFFDFTWSPTDRNTSFCGFWNNTSISRGGAFTAFHILHKSRFSTCLFAHNFCNMSAYAISIESVDADVTLESCAFDGGRDQQVRMKFGDSNLTIAANCRFGLKEPEIEELVVPLIPPIVHAVSALRKGGP